MTDWQNAGRHRFRGEGSTTWLELRGKFSVEDLRVYLDFIEAQHREHGWLTMLIDAREAGHMPAEARRYLVERMGNREPIGVSIAYGASMLVRAAALLANQALRMVGRAPTDVHFVANEAEGRVLGERLRRELAEHPG